MRRINYQNAKKARPALIICWVWSKLTEAEKRSVLKKLNYTDEFGVYHQHPRWYWIDRIFANAKGTHWRGIDEEWIDTIYLAFDENIRKKDIKDWIHDRRRLWVEGNPKKARKKKAAAA